MAVGKVIRQYHQICIGAISRSNSVGHDHRIAPGLTSLDIAQG